jgi:hypothetical protein
MDDDAKDEEGQEEDEPLLTNQECKRQISQRPHEAEGIRIGVRR